MVKRLGIFDWLCVLRLIMVAVNRLLTTNHCLSLSTMLNANTWRHLYRGRSYCFQRPSRTLIPRSLFCEFQCFFFFLCYKLTDEQHPFWGKSYWSINIYSPTRPVNRLRNKRVSELTISEIVEFSKNFGFTYIREGIVHCILLWYTTRVCYHRYLSSLLLQLNRRVLPL